MFFSTLFISSSLSSCFPIVYSITIGRAGQDVTGTTRAEKATSDSNKGHDRGAGRREEEDDGWAEVLGGGEREEQGTGWPEERSGGLNGWPVAVWRTRRTRE